MESEAIAEGGDLRIRFVIAGHHPNLGGLRPHDFAHAIESIPEVREIARSDVMVGLDRHEALEALCIVVQIREDQYAGH